MRLDAEGHEDDKIIVRSNGTVTYVGKGHCLSALESSDCSIRIS